MPEDTTIAIQGERGSFSESAAIQMLGDLIQIVSCAQFEEVFRLAAEGKVTFCLVPIENSLTGSIYKNYDLLLRNQLRIRAEINMKIEHHLIGTKDGRFEDLRTVVSHPVALDQCERFFEEHPQLQKKSSYDTSGSVRQVLDAGDPEVAGKAGIRAAEVFGGKVLMSGIEDTHENFTRFVLLSPKGEARRISDEEPNKTSIVFSFKNSPGALFKCLSVFALRDIDLTKIESRPIRGRPWEHLFYLDFMGKSDEPRTENALNHLREITDFLEVLGCYPEETSQMSKKRM